jgi:hypothetical protein
MNANPAKGRSPPALGATIGLAGPCLRCKKTQPRLPASSAR